MPKKITKPARVLRPVKPSYFGDSGTYAVLDSYLNVVMFNSDYLSDRVLFNRALFMQVPFLRIPKEHHRDAD